MQKPYNMLRNPSTGERLYTPYHEGYKARWLSKISFAKAKQALAWREHVKAEAQAAGIKGKNKLRAWVDEYEDKALEAMAEEGVEGDA